jgi:hypothetical protein
MTTTKDILNNLFPPILNQKITFLNKKQLQISLESLNEFIGYKWIENFCHMYNKPRVPFSMKITESHDILLIGYLLKILNDNLDEIEFKKVINKIIINGLSDNPESGLQLADSISEIECTATMAHNLQTHIKIDKKTGKMGSTNIKNSDIFLPDKNIYIEVKRHDNSRQKSYKKFINKTDKLFNTPGTFGINYKINKAEGDWEIIEEKNVSKQATATSISIPGNKIVNEVKDLIKDAKTKFIDEQNAIVVIDGFIGKGISNGIIAAQEYLKNNPTSPIQIVILKSKRIWSLDKNPGISRIFIAKSGNQDDSLKFLNKLTWPFATINHLN